MMSPFKSTAVPLALLGHPVYFYCTFFLFNKGWTVTLSVTIYLFIAVLTRCFRDSHILIYPLTQGYSDTSMRRVKITIQDTEGVDVVQEKKITQSC